MAGDDNYSLFKIFAGAPRTVRGRPTHISVHPLGTKFLYCNGQSVFIRDIDDPTNVDVYTQHAKETTAAVYSPSGYYICSGDVSGKIRIWDTVNAEHLLKYEYTVLGGPIKDIAWSEDSKRIAVCGEGKEEYAKIISWDTGTTCGSMKGPGKPCNNVAFKQNRPYRLVLASEDMVAYFFENIPVKLTKQIQDQHTNFVNCVRYSPDGAKFVTCGADGKCFVHDGKTGELLGELCEAAGKIHKGGIYGAAWSHDSKFLLTASADKTAKIWAMDDNFHESNKEATCFTLGNELEDMQVGCAWSKTDQILSVSLNGNINYLDPNAPDAPTRVVRGHVKAIVTSCLSADKSKLFTGSFDGLIYAWDLRTGQAELVQGSGHRSQVQNMCLIGEDNIITCGMDDTVRFISTKDNKYVENKIVKMESQPQRVAAGRDNFAVIACANQVLLMKDDKVLQTLKVNYEPTCAAMSTALNKVAIGASHSKVYLYDIENQQLKEAGSIPTNGNVTDLKFSPDSSLLAMSTGKKQVKVVETENIEKICVDQSAHAVKVNSLGWTQNSCYLTSCGIDGAVFTYCVKSNEKVVTMRGAHSLSVDVTSVQWSGENILLTTGRQDCSVRMWKVHFE